MARAATRDWILEQIPLHMRAQTKHMPNTGVVPGNNEIEQLASWIGLSTETIGGLLTGSMSPWDLGVLELLRIIPWIWESRAEEFLDLVTGGTWREYAKETEVVAQ